MIWHDFILNCPSFSMVTSLFIYLQNKNTSSLHTRYVNTVNQLLNNNDDDNNNNVAHLTLEQIIKNRQIKETNPELYNNAAQCWNHDFYWKCMTALGGGGDIIAGKGKTILSNTIQRDFGSLDNFRKEMVSASMKAFGSGWIWCGYDLRLKKLRIVTMAGAGNPLIDGVVPILAVDMWEHGELSSLEIAPS